MNVAEVRTGIVQASSFALAVVPLFFVALPPVLFSVLGPYYFSGRIDPDYAYLMNALNIVTWHSPVHIDHPGTPVQEMGAFVIAVVWGLSRLLHGARSVEIAVVSNPELFLMSINIVLGILNAAAVLLFGRRLHQVSGSLAVALGGQISLLASAAILMVTARVAPEPMLVFSTVVLMCFLVPVVLRRDDTGSSPRQAAWIGGVLGLALAVKVTALPLLASIYLIQGPKARVVAGGAVVLAFVLFTLPIVSEYPRMMGWLFDLAAHQGAYGQGEIGLPNISIFVHNLITLASKAPEIFVEIIIYALLAAVLLGTRTFPAHTGIRRLLTVAAAAAVAQIFITAKQPYAAPHYLLPATVLGSFANAGIVQLVVSSPKRLPLLFRGLVPTLLVAGVWYGGSTALAWASCLSAGSHNNWAIEEKLKSSGCTVIPYYRANQIEFALAFGNGFSGDRHRDAILSEYGNFVLYHIWSDRFLDVSSGWLAKDDALYRLSGSKCIYFVGWSVEEFGNVPMKAYLSAGLVTPVIQSDTCGATRVRMVAEVVYELHASPAGNYRLALPENTR